MGGAPGAAGFSVESMGDSPGGTCLGLVASTGELTPLLAFLPLARSVISPPAFDASGREFNGELTRLNSV
jgi:hypothetical protein